jgi:Ca2+/Na+ antiporter
VATAQGYRDEGTDDLIMPGDQVSICFASTFIEIIKIEVKNQKRPEDEKMKQIEIMYFGVTLLMWTIFYVGLYVWLPCILLCVVVLYATHWFGIYRRQRSSRFLSSPTGNIA